MFGNDMTFGLEGSECEGTKNGWFRAEEERERMGKINNLYS